MSEDQNESPRIMRPVVLCIDDEPSLLAIRQLVLAAAGYQVIATTDGSTGLELFKDSRVDLVILDHLLPDMKGSQVAQEMKRSNPDVPIILMTGLLDPPEGAEHADIFLTKGISTPEFVAAVAQLLRSKQQQKRSTQKNEKLRNVS